MSGEWAKSLLEGAKAVSKSEAVQGALKNAGTLAKKVAESEVAKGIARDARDAAIGVAKDVAADAAQAGTEKAARAVTRKLGGTAGQSVDRAMSRHVAPVLTNVKNSDLASAINEERASKAKASATVAQPEAAQVEIPKTAPVTQSESSPVAQPAVSAEDLVASTNQPSINSEGEPVDRHLLEKQLSDLGKGMDGSKKLGTVGKVVTVAGAVAGVAGGVLAAPVTAGGSVAASAGIAASAVTAISASAIVAEFAGKTFKDLSAEKQEELKEISRTMRIPPKEDIIMNFGENNDKYFKDAKMDTKTMGKKDTDKVSKFLFENGRNIGRSVIEKFMSVFYSFTALPQNEKVRYVAAIGYLLCPIDLIPDILPTIGFADDVVVMTFVYERCLSFITEEAKRSAKDFVRSIFSKNATHLDIFDAPAETPEATVGTLPAEDTIPDEIGGVKTIRAFGKK